MDGRMKLVLAATLGVAGTLAVGGVAMAARDNGLGPLGRVDLNGDNKVTRAEWLTAANARFARIDRNGDGTLIVGELPPPRAGGPGRRGRHHGPRDEWDDGDDAPPPAVAPLVDQGAATTNATGQ
jgi:EF hand